MNIDQAINFIHAGRAILFTGAGFSVGATRMGDSPIPMGEQLTKLLAGGAGIEQSVPLSQAAELFIEERGIDEYLHFLRKHFTATSVCDYHIKLAGLPWKRVYTTNYDNVFELAATKANIPVAALTLSDAISDTPKGELYCVHFNGAINKLTRTNAASEIKLSETSYVSDVISRSDWAGMFRDDVRLASAVFFIGYSLADLDLKRILVESASASKTFFIVGTNPDPILRKLLSKFGTVLDVDAADFAKMIPAPSPKTQTDIGESLHSFQEFIPRSEMGDTGDRAFHDLMCLGRWTLAQVRDALQQKDQFILRRERLDRCFELLKLHRLVVITSGIGNGKSLFLDCIKVLSHYDGYRVFAPRHFSDEAILELDELGQEEDRVLIVIDNYLPWRRAIQRFLDTAKEHHRIVVSTRTAIHEVAEERGDALSSAYVPEIELDLLTQRELDWVIATLDQRGMWGEHAAKDANHKKRTLTEGKRAQLSQILLLVFNSPDIRSRLETLINAAQRDAASHDALIMICMLLVSGFRVELDTLSYIFDVKTLNNTAVRSNQAVRELLDFDKREVRLKSPITARYILQHLADPGKQIALLTMAAQRAHQAASYSAECFDLWKHLMRYSNISLILPSRNASDLVERYYGSLRELSRAKESPLFWLQYGTACLSTGQTARAERYLSSAYAFAEKTHFDTFQIDNQYARCLLAQAEGASSWRAALPFFRDARQLLFRQLDSEELHFPYRVATNLLSLLDRHFSSMTKADLLEMRECASYVLSKAEALPERKSTHHSVVHCRKSMRAILRRCQ